MDHGLYPLYSREELFTHRATPQAEDAWVAHVNEVGQSHALEQRQVWFVGDNIPGKARAVYFMRTPRPPIGLSWRRVAAKGYEGFVLQ